MSEKIKVFYWAIHCDKHEYVRVTMSVNNISGFGSDNIEKTEWYQCRFCGKIKNKTRK